MLLHNRTNYDMQPHSINHQTSLWPQPQPPNPNPKPQTPNNQPQTPNTIFFLTTRMCANTLREQQQEFNSIGQDRIRQNVLYPPPKQLPLINIDTLLYRLIKLQLVCDKKVGRQTTAHTHTHTRTLSLIKIDIDQCNASPVCILKCQHQVMLQSPYLRRSIPCHIFSTTLFSLVC